MEDQVGQLVTYLIESENEFSLDPMIQCGDNEIKNPQVNDDEPNDAEEDVDSHDLNLVETTKHDRFNIPYFYNLIESCLTN